MQAQTFYAFVCTSIDRTERPSLRRRLEPLWMLIAELLNVTLVGVLLYALGWFGMWSLSLGPAHFSYTYFLGVLLGMTVAVAYVYLHSMFVIVRNFIVPL